MIFIGIVFILKLMLVFFLNIGIVIVVVLGVNILISKKIKVSEEMIVNWVLFENLVFKVLLYRWLIIIRN